MPTDGHFSLGGNGNLADYFNIGYTLSLRNISLSEVNVTGDAKTVLSGLTGSSASNEAINNNHVAITVNSLTGSGVVTIQGASISELSGITVAGDSEAITVDAIGMYQSDKKWWEITGVVIGAGISAIDYDVALLGYNDLNNVDFKITGYRLEIIAGGVNPDIAFQIVKVKDDGSKKMQLQLLEYIQLDSGGPNQIIDSLRTGPDDRSYNPAHPSLMVNQDTLVFKQGDFDTYFTLAENHIVGTMHEGYIIRFTGSPSGNLTNVDFVTLRLDIRPI